MQRFLSKAFKAGLFIKWTLPSIAIILAMSLFGCQKNSVPETGSINDKANWTDYTDGNTVLDVFLTGDNLWAGTESGLVDWNIDTGTYKKYTTLDGLANNYVVGITQDKAGNLWFASSGGVSRFDGKHLQSFTSKDGLPDSSITSITCDSHGNIVVGAQDYSINLYNGKIWQTISPAQKTNPNMANEGIGVAADNNGCIWAVISFQLERYDGKSWENSSDIPGFPAVYNSGSFIYSDDNRDLWFEDNLDPGLIYRYNGTSWQQIDMGSTDYDIQALTVDNHGNIWFASADTLERYDGKSWKTFTCPQKGINSLAVDNQGNIWCGIEFGPVLQFDGNSWKTYLTDDLQGINQQTFIACDNEGNTWVSTTYGLLRFDGKSWENVNHDIYDVSCFLDDKQGNLWFGTGNNLYRYDDKTWEDLSPPSDIPVNSIVEDNTGNIWVSSLFYIDRFDGKLWTIFDMRNIFGFPDPNIVVVSIMFDNQNILWVTTCTGVLRFDGISWKVYTVADGLADNAVSKIIQDKSGNIWACGSYSGLDRFDGSSWQSFLIGDRIFDIAQAQNGDIWVATDHGVARYNGTSFQVFTTADSLLDNEVDSVVIDNSNGVWCGSDQGVNYYNGKSWQSFTAADGLVGSWVTQIIKDQSGNIWLTAFGGISRYTFAK